MINILNIIIPLYKGKEVLPDCLNSLISQTKKNFFITLIQDCDGEDYIELLKEYKKKLNISYLKNKKNVGPGESRQTGINVSKQFDYIMFLDEDDILNPRAVELLYTFSKSKFADVTVSDIIVEKKYNKGHMIYGPNANTWVHGKIYRTQYLIDNNIHFWEGVRYNEDLAFNLMALNKTKKVFYLNEATYIWRDYKKSTTRKDIKDFYNKSTWQYLYGYSRSLLELARENKLTNKLIITALLSLYTQSQVLIEIKGQSNNEGQFITEFLKLDKIQDFLKKRKNLNYIVNSNKIGYTIGNKPIIFHEAFDDWINRMCGEKII